MHCATVYAARGPRANDCCVTGMFCKQLNGGTGGVCATPGTCIGVVMVCSRSVRDVLKKRDESTLASLAEEVCSKERGVGCSGMRVLYRALARNQRQSGAKDIAIHDGPQRLCFRPQAPKRRGTNA